jgi:hypothetical protein
LIKGDGRRRILACLDAINESSDFQLLNEMIPLSKKRAQRRTPMLGEHHALRRVAGATRSGARELGIGAFWESLP